MKNEKIIYETKPKIFNPYGVLILLIIGTYFVYYSATDTSGNKSTVARTVYVVDTTAPSVRLFSNGSTSDEVTNTVMETSKSLKKIPTEVNDYPGFVANKILMPMINEAIITLHEGTAGVEEIDTVMKLGMAHPMGPLQLADFIGLDVCLAILKVLQDGYGNSKYAPCPLLVNMVTAGKLGVKSGEGFYSWGHGTKDLIVANNFKK